MARILCLETATEMCSVALLDDEKLLGIRESSARNVHSVMLTTFIDELIKSSGHHFNDLDAVAVSMGPGSYTGLRIGVATAKGLCYALDKPLIAVSTLQAMAAGINDKLRITNDELRNDRRISNFQFPISNFQFPISNFNIPTLICPLIDARRMEVYSGLFDMENREVREIRAEIIDEYSFQEFLADNRVVFGGEGAEKCKSILGNHPNAVFIDGFQATSGNMAKLAAEKYKQQHFENLAYFEPFYLKDFVAGLPRVKGLNQIAK